MLESRPLSLSLTRRWSALVTSLVFLCAALIAAQSAQALSVQPVTTLPSWTIQSPATSPQARDSAVMAYDARTGNVVLFGGSSASGELNDTWTWDGTTWKQMSPASSPSARQYSSMAYDAQTGNVVLFGGYNGSAQLNDTWTWNGTTWKQMSPASSPPARRGASMAYDAQSGNVVLFGGNNGSTDLNDTWTWNGTTWKQMSPATSPSARDFASMTYVAQSGNVVLFGGNNGTAELNDTWTWNGTSWKQMSPASSPPARQSSSMAYDAQAGQAVLFGGYDAYSLNFPSGTWTWNGTAWTQQTPATSPSPRAYASMAYDARIGNGVFFGGSTPGGNYSDTWTLQLGPVNMGTANVCPAGATTPAPCTQSATLSFQVAAGTTIGSIKILTGGQTGLDFKATSPDTSSTLCTAKAYSTLTNCTIDVTFSPKYPGVRKGAVVIEDASGNLLATTFVYGTGKGPQAAFTPGTISTVAGNGTASFSGDGGTATSAEMNEPNDVAVDGAGNLYIADLKNNRIREVSATTGVITTVAGNGTQGYSGDGGTATSAELDEPSNVAIDGAGNLYIADSVNNRIREVNAATGIITTVAGNGTAGFSGDGGPASSAELNEPGSLSVDGAGNLYIADSGNNRIREVNAATGIITTVAGNGTAGFSGDGGPATSAELNYPDGLAIDAAGDLYISDGANQRVREVNAAGVITTVAGNGTAGYSGDGGTATSANLYDPTGLAVDAAGNLYIADSGNNRIREVNAATGIITTVAGNGTGGYTGDGGTATNTELNNANNVAVSGAGNLYIADTANNRIRKADVATPPRLSFASTAIGSTSSDSPLTLTVQNLGNATLTFPIPTTAGAYNPSVSTNFTYDNSSTCTQNGSGAASAFTLASATSCTVAIGFMPQTTGSITGSAVLTDDSLNAASPNYTTQSISLSGTATKAATSVTLMSSTSNANLNASITFTATVTSTSSGTPTGGVQFLDGSTVLGTSQLNNNGVATYSTSSLTAGQHSITAVYLGDSTFSGSTSAALTQTVTAPAFSLSSNKNSLTLKAGQTGQFTISMVPVGGFKGDVQFTCSGLPTLAQCTFSPASLTADGSNTTQTSTLTITTKGSATGTVSMMTHPNKPDGTMLAGLFWLPALFFGAFLFWQRKKLTAKYRVLLILLVAAATISGAVGCGSSTPHTAPGTSTITVTGTSGSTTQTVTLNVDVTQ